MKLAFLCTSLEPGRDGVGDYVANLAAELQKQGHEVTMVALADPFVADATLAKRPVEENFVAELRFPQAMPWPERIQQARQHLDEFGPEWISLQFVSYAFDPKGLIRGLADRLAPLLKQRKLHLMFHEIWLCKELGWGWRHCAVGRLQRALIQRFVRAIKPDLMHTSNSTYARLLNGAGIQVSVLGLFGNVTVLSQPDTQWIENELHASLGSDIHREDLWVFGMFGALHSQWPPEPLLTRLAQEARRQNKVFVILSIGRIGEFGAELWNMMAKQYSDGVKFLRLGEQPQQRVSECLSFLDCGIATTPLSILGKSGTTNAMLEHGLPVIVNRCDGQLIPHDFSIRAKQLILCDDQLEARLRERITKYPRGSRRPEIGHTLVSQFSSTNPSSIFSA